MSMATIAELTILARSTAGRCRRRIVGPGHLTQELGVEVLKAEDDHPVGVGRGDGSGCGGRGCRCGSILGGHGVVGRR